MRLTDHHVFQRARDVRRWCFLQAGVPPRALSPVCPALVAEIPSNFNLKENNDGRSRQQESQIWA